MGIQDIVSVIARLSMKKAGLDAALRNMSKRVPESSPTRKALKQELEMIEWELGTFQRAFAESRP